MCCKRVDDENIIETNDYSLFFKKNNYNILEQITQMKNNTNYNTEYTDKNYDLEKVKKIQEIIGYIKTGIYL